MFDHRTQMMKRLVRYKACFVRRISVASNAIQTIVNELRHLIIYCLNCIRRDWNATYKTGLSLFLSSLLQCILRFRNSTYLTNFMDRFANLILKIECLHENEKNKAEKKYNFY